MLLWLSFFFISDYVYTNHLLPKDSPHRIKHKIFHHSLLPSLDANENWGLTTYRMCTDKNGFKSNCKKILSSETSFDIAFIGDSFTEGIGMIYEDSFVGMFAESYPNIKVANLGVGSYSPTIYRVKLEHLIENGYSFNHVVVFIDISDIHDELRYFRDSKGFVYNNQPILNKINNYVTKNFSLFTFAYLSVKNLLIGETGLRNNFIKDPFTHYRGEWTYNISSNNYGDLGVTGLIDKAVLEMTLLSKFLERNNIKLSLGVYPWPNQISEMARNKTDSNLQVDIWRNFCINKCEKFINIFPKYYNLIKKSSVDEVYKNYFIKDDVHYNREGNRLIKEALLEINLFSYGR